MFKQAPYPDLMKYFIVRRFETKSGPAGESLEVFRQYEQTALAHSNHATAGMKTIYLPRLMEGLKRKDYRLVLKSEYFKKK